MALIIALLVVWLVLMAIGFAIKALLWLAVLGLIFFVVTAIAGAIHHAAGKPEK
jgi:hypothetical protein